MRPACGPAARPPVALVGSAPVAPAGACGPAGRPRPPVGAHAPRFDPRSTMPPPAVRPRAAGRGERLCAGLAGPRRRQVAGPRPRAAVRHPVDRAPRQFGHGRRRVSGYAGRATSPEGGVPRPRPAVLAPVRPLSRSGLCPSRRSVGRSVTRRVYARGGRRGAGRRAGQPDRRDRVPGRLPRSVGALVRHDAPWVTRSFDWPWGSRSQSSMKRAVRPWRAASPTSVSVR